MHYAKIQYYDIANGLGVRTGLFQVVFEGAKAALTKRRGISTMEDRLTGQLSSKSSKA